MTAPESTVKRPAEGWADVGDLRVRYLDWGGDGPPVVALHGLASSGHWYDLVAPLLCNDYRIVAPDQRGHGQTTQASGGYDWPTLASDVAGLMDRLGLDRAVVMGHSWGGQVAFSMAAHRPERVSSLVMIDGGFLDPRLSPGATWESFSHKVRPREVSGTRLELLDRFKSQLGGAWSDEVERIVQTMVYEDEAGQMHDILQVDNHAQVIRAMWDHPASTILPKIACRTLIVAAGPTPGRAGSEFAQMRRVMVGAAAAAVKGCRVHWIPNTIHDIGYDKPGELARVIGEFLAGE